MGARPASQGLVTCCGEAGSSSVGMSSFRSSFPAAFFPNAGGDTAAMGLDPGGAPENGPSAFFIPTTLHSSGSRACRKRSIMIFSTTSPAVNHSKFFWFGGGICVLMPKFSTSVTSQGWGRQNADTQHAEMEDFIEMQVQRLE